MTSWYPTTQFHHAMSPPTSGLAPDDHHSSRQESLNPGHVGYALSAAVSPSSSHRSSNSPPPSAVAPQLTTNNTTHHNQHHDPRHHDPNLYSYFPRESSNLRTVSSTEEQLQYHQWEIDQLLGSAQATPNYLSEYTSLSQHSFPPQYPSYPLSAYESRPIDHDQHSGYTSSSPPPSQVHVSHSSQINQPEAERNYEVIHHVFKPMTSDFKTSEYLPSPSSGHGHELYSQFHSMPYVTKGRFEKNPNGASRGQSTTTKKSTKENEKRFPCPDCGRMFARAFNMETHRKTHIGYRPHKCPQCHKNFSRRHDLHRHLAAVHNDHNKIPLPCSRVVSSNTMNPTLTV